MQNIDKTQRFSTRTLVTLAMLAALAVVLVWLFHPPIFQAVPFLEYDLADVPVLLAGFLFGPLAGLAVLLVASVVQAFTVSAQSGLFGLIMHLLATGALVMISSFYYRRHRTMKGAVIALMLGCLAMTVVMIPANLLVTPYFKGAPVQMVIDVMPFIVLFNIIKSAGNSLLTFLLYKRVKGLLK